MATTKKDIVKKISGTFDLPQADVKNVVQSVMDSIVDAVATEGRIELRGFGVFEAKERAPRKARNPKTGETVMVPARKVVTFKPGKLMEEKVRGEDKATEAPETPKPPEPSEPSSGFPG
jgi:nucleoid DNA-binding protein